MKSLRLLTMTAVVVLVGATASTSIAYAQSCQALWVERNSYYKQARYCFKTARAIAYFGNRGCIYQDEASVPLSGRARNRIAQITRLERAMGCD